VESDDRGPRAEKARAALAVIVQQARHIGAIVDRLRRLSRSTADDYEIHLNWLLREILCFFEKEAEAHNITLSRQFDEQLPPIRTDGSQVQQLLLALTENALDAVGADGRIDFITYATPGEVHVQIADSGADGMTSERMDRLWQPLSIGLGSKRGEGARLSLYSSIVYRLGGRISAQERPQGGTLCTVSLPARA
jgi:two-component system NtrC family sensor kinase